MTNENQTIVTGFVFIGFPHLQEGGLLFFVLLLLIYLFIIIRNLMVFFAVILDSCAHPHVFLHQCPLLSGDLVYHDHHPQDALQPSQ